MLEDEIEKERLQEFKKGPEMLAKDRIREANSIPENPASEAFNLDIIKHLYHRHNRTC